MYSTLIFLSELKCKDTTIFSNYQVKFDKFLKILNKQLNNNLRVNPHIQNKVMLDYFFEHQHQDIVV